MDSAATAINSPAAVFDDCPLAIIVLPAATVHYSKNGVDELRFIWNVQHRIYKGRMQPGAVHVTTASCFQVRDLSWKSPGGTIMRSDTAST